MNANNKNFFVIESFKKEIREIAALRYRNTKIIDKFYCLDSNQEAMYPPEGVQWQECSLGSHWKGRDRYIWVRFTINHALLDKNNRLVVYADFGTTDGWHNQGFESLCFIDTMPFQGVDQNHREIILPESYDCKETDIYLKLWSGLEGGGVPREIPHSFKELYTAELDVKADGLYFLARAAVETILQLTDEDENKIILADILEDTFLSIDWALRNNKDELYRSLYRAYDLLKARLSELPKNSGIHMSAVGHTHIDVAWLWRLKHTREKCARSFSTVLRYMDLFPEYIFHQSQAQLYEFIKKDYPEIFEKIRKRVAEGRWEPNGSMWVEADCNITGGESLVRQILFGKRFFREEFNVDCDVLWLPDVFGYSWALPQIMSKSGIKTFITSKISWNKYNKMPYDTFLWRGLDGSEVLTHFITTPEVQDQESEWRTDYKSTYNGHLTPYTVRSTWERYTNKDIYKGQLIPFGYGDGGGGVDRTTLELYRAMKQLPGLPELRQEKVSDFTAKLHEAFDNTDKYRHVWDGELYLEYHRGTYTSQAFIKKENRKLEFKYRLAEILSVYNAVNSDFSLYEQKALNDGWKIILRNQFHDIIPGSSIAEVYEDARKEYGTAEKIAEDVIFNSIRSLTAEAKDHYTVFNSCSFERTDSVFIKRDGSTAFYDGKGAALEAAEVEGGYTVIVPEVPSMGSKTIIAADRLPAECDTAFSFIKNTVETPFYRVVFKNGYIESVYDKENSREVMAQPGNVLEVFEDRPLNFDAWDIDIFYNNKRYDMDELAAFRLKELNNLRLVLNVAWKYRNSTIRQDIIFYKHTRRIDFVTGIVWNEQQQLLKVKFPVDVRATKALYDIQFGNVERPTYWNTSWDMAKFEVAGHKWADISEGDYGVALMNDCKYGYDIKDSNMRLTLIKSAVYPDPDADQGEHSFTYSLYPHRGSFKDSEVEQEALSLNEPLRVFGGKGRIPFNSLLSVNTGNVLIDAVKKAEDRDAIIVRLHEYKGCRAKLELSSAFDIARWQETDLMENPSGEINQSAIQLFIKPYEIKTLLIEPKYNAVKGDTV
ncbi:MAG TPA: alpha-mannosidase [Clostridia bacterium]|nr:alpha-mannosidase [Clostridia bacterium]